MTPEKLNRSVRLWIGLMWLEAVGTSVALLLSIIWPGNDLVTRSGYSPAIYDLVMLSLTMLASAILWTNKKKTGHAYGLSLGWIALYLAGTIIWIALYLGRSYLLIVDLIGPGILAIVLVFFLRNREELRRYDSEGVPPFRANHAPLGS